MLPANPQGLNALVLEHNLQPRIVLTVNRNHVVHWRHASLHQSVQVRLNLLHASPSVNIVKVC